MDISIDVSQGGIPREDLEKKREEGEQALSRLWSGELPYTGWVSLPLEIQKKDSFFMEEVERMETVALAIQNRCKLFVVIGIGGSYLGARAALEALGPKEGYPEIRFAGFHLSGTYHEKLLEEVMHKDTCLCVISKSGTTTEPSFAFSVLKEAMIEKYGEKEAFKRIFAVTDSAKGILCQECQELGYTQFEIPDDIGGRYSVLTAVGLLPLAVAGMDIRALLEGAYECASDPGWDHELVDYGILRYLLWGSGKRIEIFEYYEPRFQYFAEWLKQLFGESEGKEGKGLYPASLSFTADLHSMGQFLQEGTPLFFETILDLQEPEGDVWVTDVNSPFYRMSMNQVNRAAIQGVMKAHSQVGTPMVKIEIPKMNERILGQLFYFFETSCAITALLMGVNPFDQPGVEAYKAEMKKELERDSFQEEGSTI
jgi:glucose-6-phosphate isomerase